MTRRLLATSAGILALVSGCVTINVYFPAVAAERAADRVISDVWGPSAPQAPGSEEQSDPGTSSSAWYGNAALVLLDTVIPAARAAEPEIDTSAPAVRDIIASMEARHSKLKPFYGSGAIGLTRKATITVRDMAAVGLAKRNKLKSLVAAENADRKALYHEIAVTNDHPEWASRIRDIFAERWIANAQPGWYYQNDDGDWVRKEG